MDASARARTDAQVVRLDVGGVELAAEVRGRGPAVLLVHGFPHTRRIWDDVAADLAVDHRVVAVDLRGHGESERSADGYDGASLAADLVGVLDALALPRAHVVAIDAGAPPAFLVAAGSPERVDRLVLMESTLGRLPGAEDFFAAGAPWWFGFHQVPGLAERVLAGDAEAYLDFFWRAGTHDRRGLRPAVRAEMAAAYSDQESLRCAFETYRAMSTTAAQIEAAATRGRIAAPTLAIGAEPVGGALAGQLAAVTDRLASVQLEECGHIVPVDRPDLLVPLLRDWFGEP